MFFYLAYILVNIDPIDVRLTPLESRGKALSNEVYIDFGHMVAMSHAFGHMIVVAEMPRMWVM